MKKQVVLHSKRLILRPFNLDDAPTVQKLANDKRIAEATLNIPHPYPDCAAEKWILTHEKLFDENKEIIFAITLKESGEVIGAIGMIMRPEFNKAEFGYWIGVDFWNKGYASEALQSILKYGFLELKLNKMYAHHFTINPVSGKVMIKNGLREVGYLKEDIIKDGKYIDVKLYEMLQKEYLNLSQNSKIKQIPIS